MRYMITKNFITVLGYIWQPGIGICSMEYPVSAYDIENIGELTRKNCEQWLMTHSGDFSSIVDFKVSIEDFESDWEKEDSVEKYYDTISSEFDDEVGVNL